MNKLTLWFHKTGSPEYFYHLSGRLIPWFGAAFLILLAWGLYQGLWVAPADYQFEKRPNY